MIRYIGMTLLAVGTTQQAVSFGGSGYSLFLLLLKSPDSLPELIPILVYSATILGADIFLLAALYMLSAKGTMLPDAPTVVWTCVLLAFAHWLLVLTTPSVFAEFLTFYLFESRFDASISFIFPVGWMLATRIPCGEREYGPGSN